VKLLIAIGVIVNLLAACMTPTPIAPPDAKVPAAFRGPAGPTASIATMPWTQLYPDPVLRDLIATALSHNLSVAAAYQAILAAEANVAVKAGAQQPQVNAQLQAPFNYAPGQLPLTVIVGNNGQPAHTVFVPSLGVGVSYEVDLFGKLASATAAARSQLLSTVEAHDAVTWQLIAAVGTAYFTLRALDAQLVVAQRNLAARKQNLDLVQARYQGGISDLQAVRQAEESYYRIGAAIPEIQRQIALSEDAISTLIGSYPKDIPRGLELEQQIALPPVPAAGVPSELLIRRPDIMQAEANLAAASANVDEARALLYPQLTIGGGAGIGYTAINSIFYGPTGLFSVVPSLLAPLFNGGALHANVRLTQAQREQVAIAYLQTVQTALQEVADDLASYDRLRAASAQADQRTTAGVDATRLATLRYEGGVTSYLEVLDSETRSTEDELSSVQAHLNERLALVRLYLALGGGWQAAGTAAR